MNFLTTFFVNKTRFLLIFFQVHNLKREYTGLFWSKAENILFLHIFEDISTENQYFFFLKKYS